MAYDAVVASPLCGRTAKPRSTGQTMVIDKGMGLSQIVDLLELASEYVDFVKSCPKLVRATLSCNRFWQ